MKTKNEDIYVNCKKLSLEELREAKEENTIRKVQEEIYTGADIHEAFDETDLDAIDYFGIQAGLY